MNDNTAIEQDVNDLNLRLGEDIEKQQEQHDKIEVKEFIVLKITD